MTSKWQLQEPVAAIPLFRVRPPLQFSQRLHISPFLLGRWYESPRLDIGEPTGLPA